MKMDLTRMSGIDRRLLGMRILEAVKKSADDPAQRAIVEARIEREGRKHGVQRSA